MQVVGSCLACSKFLIVPTGAGNVAEDMITDTEVNHTLKFGHQEYVRRDACNVGDETRIAPIVQLNNETLDFLTDSFEQDGSLATQRMKSRLMNGVCLLPIQVSNSVQPNYVPKLLVARDVSLCWNPACFGFLAERDDDAFDDERKQSVLCVLVHSMKQVFFYVSFDGIEPSTLLASLSFPVDPSL